ncbi:Heat Stress Transcription Factor family protein [Quillaja saponaria]|uniref:Heat Stress Transcription Factor family protein n=1 Tax=Quillaja saponaria TaxID=32244 RepID=A0AAD7LFR7_QUISA|nr:Heat Stress Transcription Factor family protein [Quillaja saponaria]
MDGDMAAASGGGGGSTGGPAPFLLKTYDMVDDSSTDDIVSWTSHKNSFVVWNPPEFARVLLPMYFKHNNFSSFIRQLNTYGFRKVDPERWEFANEDFIKDQKHLLKNIYRRKPIHSHSQPQGSLMDPEKASFDEEIERLLHEKAALESNILRFKQQRSSAKLQLEDLTERIDGIEKRQESLLSFFEKALQNPTFVEHLSRKIESMDLSVFNKKRRLPQVEPVAENNLIDNSSRSRPEFGNIFHQDFSNKLRLELSSAVSDINLVSNSTQSSNKDGGSPHRKIYEGEPKGVQQARIEALVFAPETLEPSESGTSFTFKMNSLSRRPPCNESTKLHALQPSLNSNEEGDGLISCHLNLTLASSPLQVSKNPYTSRSPHIGGQEIVISSESRLYSGDKESVNGVSSSRNAASEVANLASSQEATDNNQAIADAPVRVNDLFWEQFLTERPGCTDNEEAISNYRSNPYDEKDYAKLGHGISRNVNNMDQLTL